ncbi:MAG: HEAT repeat domain-containing protein [Nitrospirae bacterium]|nr:HEAT repeat domain-containing protein [Nitrospirota bacterium]
MEDEHPKVRENAAWALGEIKDERAVKPLMKIMFQDKNSDVKKSAAIARSKINKALNK